MATPRPKYVAVVPFAACGKSFDAGDPVPAGLALDAALRYGDRFVTRRPKTRPTTPPPAPPQE